ncbi:MAG: hypothetical protein RL149_143 [Actinomycetota bacterium]|jgi:shikimate dehydrogenase
MSRHLAVLGSPIEHSKSPAIHNAAYRTLQLNWDYSRVEVSSNHLMQFIENLDGDWLGLSLTMPLKEEACRIANEKTDLVESTGVANTLLRTTAGWRAYNTDVFGIQRALASVSVEQVKHICIIGSGATATSAVFAVSQIFPTASIRVIARNADSAKKLKNRALQNGIKILVSPFSKIRSKTSKSDLTISTVPAGALDSRLASLKGWRFKPKGTLLDVAYDPWPSPLAAIWQSKGARIINGVEMLLWQAIAQIRIFDHSDMNVELPNERAVELAMRHELNLL